MTDHVRFAGWIALVALATAVLLAPSYAATHNTVSTQPAQANRMLYLPMVNAATKPPSNIAFDPAQHAFSFRNYVNRPGYTNMLPADVQRMFGNGVCAAMDGKECLLTPAADEWRRTVNKNMGGGHCEGLAVLSQLFFNNRVALAGFGVRATPEIKLEGNQALQREIAYWWATQTLKQVQNSYIFGTPREILNRLQAELPTGKAGEYVLAIRQDGKGHAVTPYEVRNLGNNQYQILVYDNNIPLKSRAVEVDLNTNSWIYSGSTNPDVVGKIWSGDASTKSMLLKPTSNRLGRFRCDICEDDADQMMANAQNASQKPTQIWLNGDANLLITDTSGRRLGYVGNQLVNEIPGADFDFLARQEVDPWLDKSEPLYFVPAGIDYKITLDGSQLTAQATSELTVLGPGYVLEVRGIVLDPGQIDEMDVDPQGNLLSYRTASGETPNLVLGFETPSDDYTVKVMGFELGANGGVRLVLDEAAGTVSIDALDVAAPIGFDLIVKRVGAAGAQVFATDSDATINPDDVLYLSYKDWPGNGQPMSVGVDSGGNGTIDQTITLPDAGDVFDE